ncbi:Uncharacterised protein [Klebsiella pneumoniae]|nr:Uncharacterised protein [Klebsiella pneumoniae]
MSNEDEFFAEMHPQIAQVIGIAVMQLLVEKREPSREALIEMIQVLWLGDQPDLAVELALDVLMLREERGRVGLDQCFLFESSGLCRFSKTSIAFLFSMTFC